MVSIRTICLNRLLNVNGTVNGTSGRKVRMDTLLYFLFAAVYVGLLVWGLAKQRRWNFMSVIFLVGLGLVYDNAIIAVGRFIGEGALLEALNLARYWAHAFLTPLLVLFAYGALRVTGVGWARKKAAKAGFFILTAGLVIIEILFETWELQLELERSYGLLRYASAEPSSGPPIMVLAVIVVLIAAGAIVWKRTGWKWMLIGSVLMALGNAVPIPVDSSAVTNAFELILLLSLVWTKIHLETTHDKGS